MRNPHKPPPSPRAQKWVAGAVWGLVAFLAMTGLSVALDLSILWWGIATISTVVLVVLWSNLSVKRDVAQQSDR